MGSGPAGPIRIPMGPARVWYRCRGEVMGLAMSRSLGDDMAHRAGVSSDPELTEHVIDPNDKVSLLDKRLLKQGYVLPSAPGYHLGSCISSLREASATAFVLACTVLRSFDKKKFVA